MVYELKKTFITAGLYELLVPMGQVMDDASNVVDFPS